MGSSYEDAPVVQKAIRISELDAETTNSEGENDIMKINNKALKQIIIDEDRKTVTAIATDDQSVYNHYLGVEPIKYVTVAKATEEDDISSKYGSLESLKDISTLEAKLFDYINNYYYMESDANYLNILLTNY